MDSIENIDYNIFGILNRNSKNNYSYFTRYSSDNNYTNNNINIENNKRVIFSITPDIKNDIYNLNIYGPNGIVFYQYAYIPDYKTSVMMNNHFRIIKENTNLDLLEESDDEEEFENITPDKFVYLEKSLNFECIYNKKFKKWIPVKKTNEKKITNFTTLKNIIYK